MRVLSIGEVLWDRCGETKTLGGAPLNFSAHLSRFGNTAAILSAVGTDPEGLQADREAAALGIDLRFLQSTALAPTGCAHVTHEEFGDPLSHIHRPAAYDFLEITSATVQAVHDFDPEWLYIGTLFHVTPDVAQRTLELRKSLSNVRVFYDINLRQDNWNYPLVRCLSRNADVVKMNEPEARLLAELSHFDDFERHPEAFCGEWLRAFDLECVCVTFGAEGCLVVTADESYRAACMPIVSVDALGAGDAFSAGFLHGWHNGWGLHQSSRLANVLGGLVASRSGAIPDWSIHECGLPDEHKPHSWPRVVEA
jgi:fructokinase